MSVWKIAIHELKAWINTFNIKNLQVIVCCMTLCYEGLRPALLYSLLLVYYDAHWGFMLLFMHRSFGSIASYKSLKFVFWLGLCYTDEFVYSAKVQWL